MLTRRPVRVVARRARCRRSSPGRCDSRSCPTVGPPQTWRRASLSMIQFIARRTWMSSNGGCVRFIVRYCVPSRRVEVQELPLRRIGRVLLERLRGQARAVLVVELAGGDPVDDVGRVRVDRELELGRGSSGAPPASRSSGRSRGCGRASASRGRRSRSSPSASRTRSRRPCRRPRSCTGPSRRRRARTCRPALRSSPRPRPGSARSPASRAGRGSRRSAGSGGRRSCSRSASGSRRSSSPCPRRRRRSPAIGE